MIVLVRIPQAQSRRTEQPTSKVDGRTSNMAIGTEPKEVTLKVDGNSFCLFFSSKVSKTNSLNSS